MPLLMRRQGIRPPYGPGRSILSSGRSNGPPGSKGARFNLSDPFLANRPEREALEEQATRAGWPNAAKLNNLQGRDTFVPGHAQLDNATRG